MRSDDTLLNAALAEAHEAEKQLQYTTGILIAVLDLLSKQDRKIGPQQMLNFIRESGPILEKTAELIGLSSKEMLELVERFSRRLDI